MKKKESFTIVGDGLKRYKQELFSYNNGIITEQLYLDLKDFSNHLKALASIASKETHYKSLNIWNEKLYEFIDAKLELYGFINGNTEQNLEAGFWWIINCIAGSIIYSGKLKTHTEIHHSSAFERNEAFIEELNEIMEEICYINYK